MFKSLLSFVTFNQAEQNSTCYTSSKATSKCNTSPKAFYAIVLNYIIIIKMYASFNILLNVLNKYFHYFNIKVYKKRENKTRSNLR